MMVKHEENVLERTLKDKSGDDVCFSFEKMEVDSVVVCCRVVELWLCEDVNL